MSNNEQLLADYIEARRSVLVPSATLTSLKAKADKNWKEHKALLTAMRFYLNDHEDVKDTISAIDSNFLRKLYYYPNDITSVRVSTVIKKLGL